MSNSNVSIQDTSVFAKRCQIVTDFYTLLFPNVSGYLNQWTSNGLRSHWFDISLGFEVAAEKAIQINEASEVWFQTGLTGSALGDHSKGTEAQIILVPGIHADIDWQDDCHKKADHLPPTIEAALGIISAAALPPTIIVNSGHGLQPYWLFEAPADTSTPEQSKRIKSLIRDWQAMLRCIAIRDKWTIDATHNLDRLMRIPGTVNRKREPVPVKVLEKNECRYTVETLEEAVKEFNAKNQDTDEIQFNDAPQASPAPRVTITNKAVDKTLVSYLTDEQVIQKASAATNGQKFRELYIDGTLAGFPSASEAVQSLLCTLAYWTGKNPAQMERIASTSKLVADYAKWHQRQDYRDRSIQKAIETIANVYDVKSSSIEDDLTSSPNEKKSSQADMLVALACDHLKELFTDEKGKAYATVPAGDHCENRSLSGKSFGEWLSRAFWLKYQKAPGAQPIKDAINVLSAKAKFEGKVRSVFVRIAEHEGHVYIDLANEKWEAVEITRDGWTVVSSPPVKFLRFAGTLPLPTPVSGGTINELRPLINASEDETWVLLVAWLVGALCPHGPYTVLAVNGEQGSAKSTTCRYLRSLIDPNKAALRGTPRDHRDLVIAGSHSLVVGFDNLSNISPDLSDNLCRIATGESFGTRTNYTDDEETLFNLCRPIILNGIGDMVTRPDLLERSLPISLPSIPESQRATEVELEEKMKSAHPRILGALLSAVSTALRELPNVSIKDKPRMADFAKWIVSAESALPWEAGTFMRTYQNTQENAASSALENSSIFEPLRRLLEENGGAWTGTASELRAKLIYYMGDEMRHSFDFPKTSHGLSGLLQRLAPSLRAVGIMVTRDRSKHARTITITSATAAIETGSHSWG